MSTHTTPHIDKKVLLALVPLASFAASHPHEGNPNAHGPVNFSEIAQSIASVEASISSSSHSTHPTPSLLHGIIPNITTSTSTDTEPLVIIPTRTATVWATVIQQTQVVTVVKTVAPTHKPSATIPIATRSSTSRTTSTDTDPLVIIPVTGTATDLVNYGTYTIPASLPPLPPRPMASHSASNRSKSAAKSSTTDDGPLEIIPVTGTITELANYDTVMVPTATATTVVIIPVSSGSGSGSESQGSGQGQNMGQMLGHIQGMGQSSSRAVMHPIVSLGDRLTVVTGGDGKTTITRASPTAPQSTSKVAEGNDGKVCKEEQ
ncbi:hypothetical protein QBC32DRAFT_253689 [Pseudoneurospora amorphoporcata]|uniref:Uncharacterized protein n=1 Tax=Pseudoneurospora amorphoporcata TaxID=241081 RepID=A0AAN6SJE3_9PEZI|nr:hypothetical protein QBC32DRAFT_253689 [Pseudoneurospora amorphoporcata]